jgi:hypothetical protein
MVLIVANRLRVGEAISADKAKASLLIAILISIFILSNPISAKADGAGLLVMETSRPGFYPLEEITVKCFYFDNLNNYRRDDPWKVSVPTGPHLEVRLKVDDRDLDLIESPQRIKIIHPGPVITWHIKPYREGKYKLVLDYFINGKPYSKPSEYIRI